MPTYMENLDGEGPGQVVLNVVKDRKPAGNRGCLYGGENRSGVGSFGFLG
jgi:hypothetical protein